MAYDATKPTDDEYLSAFPAEMREQLRAIIQDAIVNALTVRGYSPGNLNGNIPVSNGNLNANLNADKLDGRDATYFSANGHVHAAATPSTNGFMSNTDKTKVDGIATGAEVNQNAFSNVAVGSTTIQADSKADTLTLEAGANIAITPDATNDKVTIAVTGTVPKAAAADNATYANTADNATRASTAYTANVVQRAIQPRGVNTSNTYIFYGTLTTLQTGAFFKLDVLGGNGYTGDITQSIEGTLYFRTGNGNSASYAAYSEYHRNSTNGLKFFIVKDSGTQYRIYSDRTGYTGSMQVLPYISTESSFDLSLTTVSALPSGAVEVESLRLVYSSTVNNYAPTNTGSGASGTWPISITGSATKAGTADNATHAGTADSATKAGTADNANALNGYTAAQLAGEFSHATNGYHKFPGGTIIQWGVTPAVAENSSLAVTFPIAFPNAVLNVSTCQIQTGTSNNYVASCVVKSGYTTTGFTLMQDMTNTYAVNEMWLAIGY